MKEKKSFEELIQDDIREIRRRAGHDGPLTLKELNKIRGDMMTEDERNNAVLITKIKCPVCKEGWDLEYDEYTDLYYCGACAGVFKLEA